MRSLAAFPPGALVLAGCATTQYAMPAAPEGGVSASCVVDRVAQPQANTYSRLVVSAPGALALDMKFYSANTCRQMEVGVQNALNGLPVTAEDSPVYRVVERFGVLEQVGEFFIDQFGRGHLFVASEDPELTRPVTEANHSEREGLYARTQVPRNAGGVSAFMVNTSGGLTVVLFEAPEGADEPFVDHAY